MKKYKYVLLSVFVSFGLLLTPFFCANNVKAAALTPATTTSYGSYIAETYYANSGTYPSSLTVGVPGVFEISIPQDDTSVFHFHYDFDTSSSMVGLITIVVTSTRAYKLNDANVAVDGGYFQSLPSKTQSSTQKSFTIGIYNTDHVDLYISCTAALSLPIFDENSTFTVSHNIERNLTEYYLQEHIDTVVGNVYDSVSQIEGAVTTCIDYKLSDMADSFYEMIDVMAHQFTYQIPLDRVGAFDLFKQVANSVLVGGYSSAYYIYNSDQPIPYIYASSNKTGQFYAYKDRTYYLSYAKIRDGNFALSDDFTLVSANANQTFEVERIDNVIYTTISNGLYVVTFKITVSGVNGYIRYTPTHDFSVYPLFFGRDDSYVSDETASFTAVPINSQYVSLIQQILETLDDIDFGSIGIDKTLYDVAVDRFQTFGRSIDPIDPSKTQIENDIGSVADITVDESTDTLFPALQLTNTLYTGITHAFPWLKTFIVMSLSIVVLKVIFG